MVKPTIVKDINFSGLTSGIDKFEEDVDNFIHDKAEEFQELIKLKILGVGAYDTGKLLDNVKLEENYMNYWVYVDTDEVPYAIYIEYGTGKHGLRGVPIRPKNAKFLSWIDKATGKRVFAKEVKGQVSRPYFRLAQEHFNRAGTFNEQLEEFISERLELLE